jgi:prepilin-type N-terminal cleavage/methylation domain-containing protein
MTRTDGFSLVETIVALAIVLLVTGAALGLSIPSSGIAESRAEGADMQQRLRVAADSLYRRLVAAGAGAYADGASAALVSIAAPILPYRFGGTAANPPGSYKTDTITVLSVPRTLTQAVGTTYWLKRDDATDACQLMMNETTSNLDIPVVDHVVGLSFEYFADPQPPLALKAPSDPEGPWTTYGPKPATTAVGPFDAGENCIFVNDGSELPRPRLADLGDGSNSLVKLAAGQLSDGPWCPDDTAADRWDADLLRIRSVAVVIRVESAVSALRGPASVLFARTGTSRSADRWVPDQEVRFQVSPRNLNTTR